MLFLPNSAVMGAFILADDGHRRSAAPIVAEERPQFRQYLDK